MKTDTKYFGEIAYEKDELLTFPKGLYGFEDEQAFLLLPFAENGTLFSLQSVKTPQLAFILMDPFSLDGGYAPVLQEDELEFLNVERSEDLFYYVMCVVKDPVPESTVNMRCPVAINDGGTGLQVILENTSWHMRHQLSEFGRDDADETGQREEETPC
ncbi:MAG: flagellar assembly protein FliW [Oscillospiraceae bacterium]|nr:flagellar assembly protein FliW [Oscillospiraceae bacterium]